MTTRIRLVAELRSYANEAVTYNNKGIYGQISMTALDDAINKSQLKAVGVPMDEVWKNIGTVMQQSAFKL